MKIKELIEKGVQNLRDNQIEDAVIKAKTVLSYILDKDKIYLLSHDREEVEKAKEIEYMRHIEELIQGKPLQYITHTQEFMGLHFYVDENVLIPQPDTEILVEEAIKVIKEKQKAASKQIEKGGTKQKTNEERKIRILDLCTGSGAIAIGVAKYMQKSFVQVNQEKIEQIPIDIEIYGTDISKEAIKIAERNAESNKIKIDFILSDMFQSLEQYKGYFDVIVSNPPYIESSTIAILPKEVQHEPYLALDGGKDGLKFYTIIANQAYKYLKADGEVLVEIGYNQKESVTKVFKENEQYGAITCIKDLSNNDRVLKIKCS